MIYTATKNNYSRTFSVEDGDLKAKKKLCHYRREGWSISARIAESPDPTPRSIPRVTVLPKKLKKEKELIKVLGHWMEID